MNNDRLLEKAIGEIIESFFYEYIPVTVDVINGGITTNEKMGGYTVKASLSMGLFENECILDAKFWLPESDCIADNIHIMTVDGMIFGKDVIFFNGCMKLGEAILHDERQKDANHKYFAFYADGWDCNLPETVSEISIEESSSNGLKYTIKTENGNTYTRNENLNYLHIGPGIPPIVSQFTHASYLTHRESTIHTFTLNN